MANAEQELVNLALAWPQLSIAAKPTALKFALLALVILWLDSPIRAKVFLQDVSRASGLEPSELCSLVERRANVCLHYRELWERNQVVTESEVLSWVL